MNVLLEQLATPSRPDVMEQQDVSRTNSAPETLYAKRRVAPALTRALHLSADPMPSVSLRTTSQCATVGQDLREMPMTLRMVAGHLVPKFGVASMRTALSTPATRVFASATKVSGGTLGKEESVLQICTAPSLGHVQRARSVPMASA